MVPHREYIARDHPEADTDVHCTGLESKKMIWIMGAMEYLLYAVTETYLQSK